MRVCGTLPADADSGRERCKPAFLITVDTEGDNLWASPREVTTRNSAFLPRFQSLCERYGLKPTYLTTWEMANCPVFQSFARDVAARAQGEIGMHLHAWNSPPLEPDDAGSDQWGRYLTEYAEATMRAKTRRLTEELESQFGRKVVSHRAGRWSFNDVYARILIEQGYLVDCSVTPHVTWKSRGERGGRDHVVDYARFPERAYLLDLERIDRPGTSRLLEVPMTILRRPGPAPVATIRRVARRSRVGKRLMDRLLPEHWWLRPNRHNGKRLLRVLEIAGREGRDYVEFMLHSSELMPGGSPIFPTERSIERLYADMEGLFGAASARFEGMTLAAYRDRFMKRTSNRAEVSMGTSNGAPEVSTMTSTE
jgi:peptidoglycan/xylan/chitin deacetylase (PgdA/CDA1 family)